MPAQTYVSTVLPSKHKAGRVYVTFDGHYTDDYKPYVFVSEDFGATWRSLVERDCPRRRSIASASIRRIRVCSCSATSAACTSRTTAARRGQSLATNMPTVPVDDAVFQERDNALVVGTHGRGIWVLDDVGPLEALTADAMSGRRDAAADRTRAAHEHVLAAGVVRPRRVLRAESRTGTRSIAYNLRDGGERARPTSP